MIRNIIILLLTCVTLSAAGQNIRRDNDKTSSLSQGSTKESSQATANREGETMGAAEQKQEIPDTIYCLETKKQHGRFAPQKIIPADQASMHYYTLRFTNKYENGYYGKLEVLDAYGNLRQSPFSPYILDLKSAESDSTANESWVRELQKVCQYEFIQDPTGYNIIQERAYDKDMNLIYSFSITPIDEKTVIGSYKDNHGLPAEMRKDPNYTYGTLVKIISDQWGNDSIIQCLDAKGRPKQNYDGSYAHTFISNAYGYPLMNYSCDSIGQPVFDNWGNSGMKYEYDKNWDIKTKICTNDKLQPMLTLAKRAQSIDVGVAMWQYKYDEYHRDIESAFFNVDGQPCENINGAHKTINQYDGRGNCILFKCLSLNGSLVDGQGEGWAIYKPDYYDNGKCRNRLWYDTNEKLIFREYYEYDDNGSQTLYKSWHLKDDKLQLNYIDSISHDYEYVMWEDGECRIDSLDEKGRLTFRAFYNADRTLRPCDEGWAKKTWNYFEGLESRSYVEMFYDVNGDLTNGKDGYAKGYYYYTDIDTLHYLVKKIQYTKDGILLNTLAQLQDDDRILAEYDMNAFGEICRAGGTSGVRHYKADVIYTPQGKFASLIGRDEFDEPDYITTSNLTYYYQRFTKDQNKFYNAENEEIEDNDELRDALPKVMTIEVVDSAAYRRGLRDNDVIILYGDYTANLDTIVSYNDFRKEWTLRSVLDARKNKRMVVFRIEDASKNKYGLVEIDGLEGTASELGFIAHIRYLTKKQTARIKRSIEDNLASASPLLTREKLRKSTPKGNKYVVLAFTEMYRSYRDYPYAKQVTDPAVLLSACIKDRNMKWSVEDGENTDVFSEMLNSRKSSASCYPTMNFYLTKDAQTITPLVLEDQAVYTNWFEAYLTDEDYAQLSSLYTAANMKVKQLLKQPSAIPAKNFIGYWEIQPKENDNYPVTGHMELMKNGNVQGEISNYGYIEFNEGRAIYKKTTMFDGTWSNGGNWLFLSNPEDISLECVDLLSADKDMKDRAMAFVNSNLKSDKDYLQSQLEEVKFLEEINNELYITSCDKKSFMSTDSLIFVKAKKPKDIKPKMVNTEIKYEPIYTKEIDAANPLIGIWKSMIPEYPDSYVELSLYQDGKMNLGISMLFQEQKDTITTIMDLEIGLEGTWYAQNTESLKMEPDPAKMTIDAAFDFVGIDEATQIMKRAELKRQMADVKQILAMQMLKSFDMFDKDIKVSEVDTCKLVFNDNTWNRVPDNRSIVLGRIEGDEGYLVENGFSGLYVILEWCGWNCRQDTDDFSAEFEKNKNSERHLVLLPVESVNGEDVFKDVVEVTCPQGLVDMRVSDITISHSYYKYNILKRYLDWKMNR